jgi:hypothetical protein
MFWHISVRAGSQPVSLVACAVRTHRKVRDPVSELEMLAAVMWSTVLVFDFFSILALF